MTNKDLCIKRGAPLVKKKVNKRFDFFMRGSMLFMLDSGLNIARMTPLLKATTSEFFVRSFKPRIPLRWLVFSFLMKYLMQH
jgi:hypothetical protein